VSATVLGDRIKVLMMKYDLDAWSRYRQALGAIALNGWNEEALAKTTTHLRDAIALDPNFALAHARVVLFGAIRANMSFAEDRFAPQQQALCDADGAAPEPQFSTRLDRIRSSQRERRRD
jgi:hypothetical protein